MLPVAITSLYAAICALLLVLLSVRVIRQRRARRIALGDGGHDDLARAIRAQGNLTEYAPLALLLLLLLELSQQVPAWALHLLGVGLVVGRAVHALGILTPAPHPGRVAGMGLTFTSLVVMALWLLALALPELT
jgi:uncharacterized membrane protein YecN with MAPEG domain